MRPRRRDRLAARSNRAGCARAPWRIDPGYFFLPTVLSATLSAGLAALSVLGVLSVFGAGFVSALATAVAGFFFVLASAACGGGAAPRSGRFFPGVIPIVCSRGGSP